MDISELLKYKSAVDCDDVRFKEIIKEKLLENEKLIYVLNNKELQEADAEISDYFGINILPFFMITPTQSNVQNFVCYEVQFDEEARYNNKYKIGQIIFHILSEQKNIIETTTGIARHDLLAAIILEDFNWTNLFGTQIHCVSDKASVIDNSYACRTLVFEGQFVNSLAKTKDGKTMIVNNYGNNR